MMGSPYALMVSRVARRLERGSGSVDPSLPMKRYTYTSAMIPPVSGMLRCECNCYIYVVCAVPNRRAEVHGHARDGRSIEAVNSMIYEDYLRGTTGATFARDTHPVRPFAVSTSRNSSCSAVIFTFCASGIVNSESPMGTGETRAGAAPLMTMPSCSVGHSETPLHTVRQTMAIPSNAPMLRIHRYRGEITAATVQALMIIKPMMPIHDAANGVTVRAMRSKRLRADAGRCAEAWT